MSAKQLGFLGLVFIFTGIPGFLWGQERFYSMADFKQVRKIDAHVHIRTTDTSLVHQARLDNFRLLTIVVDEPPGIKIQQRDAIQHMKAFPRLVAFATTFSVEDWNSSHWQDEAIASLAHSFKMGAIAVKVYKNIGMELKDKSGHFVRIDNPRFNPIFNFIIKNHITVIGHNGEPKDCWLPMDKMTMNADKRYYSRHPEFYMYLHPEYPSYEDQINARDHLLAMHPDLRFVGAHLGSIEWSTDELAKRLDRFPNMAVDVAARIGHLEYQAMKNWKKVHDFFIKYQDRIIYGTDRISDRSKNPKEFEEFVHTAWLKNWEFFCTKNTMHSSSFDKPFKGLKLPQKVIDKIYYKNAERWFPPLKKLK